MKEFEHAGLRCVVRKYRTWHTGYVGVPEGHPLFGKDYSDEVDPPDSWGDRTYDDVRTPVIPMMFRRNKEAAVSIDLAVDVHGGVTFSSQDLPVPDADSAGLWWFGFDVNHAGDNESGRSRDFAYAETECKKMADSLSEFRDDV